ncbi:PLP-dependent aminotransferase family protein [Paenibacillus sp. UMB4589-SE434]|uniref:MocR-like pyridoxine biosynthesis transcription factor PdxR n=1 Tax=Paenibacillus sp. UMB4589-SE434 TaxID=3046314 RepID=UPI00254F88B9|nr:PLP-dependent aminotransferase family protein [Paenibacillus sp. UMB4589-SE434]MDK8183628.1 PLP-dependent aminotransferase family protein [Paenibacillus sp. UMB4589-SE434]
MNGLAAYTTWLESGYGKGEALYRSIRQHILEGKLTSGVPLASTREVAKQLSLSRGTVLSAYDRLISEGYAEAAQGSHTRVARMLKLPLPSLSGQATPEVMLSEWAERVVQAEGSVPNRLFNPPAPNTIDLSLGWSSSHGFPVEDWQRCLRLAIREMDWQQPLAQLGSAGLHPLQQAIAAHLMRHRGVSASPDRIVLTHGSKHALTLLVQLLAGQGDAVLIETPGYRGIHEAVRAAGGDPLYFAVEMESQLSELLHGSEVRLAIVTPNRHFPTGRTMSVNARGELLSWAQAGQKWIIEDDYDSEFGFGGKRYEPLQSMDRHSRVIYVGSFTRTLSAKLRIGYMVVPDVLLTPVHSALRLYSYNEYERVEYAALARFMNSGEYERHLRRINREHRRKVQIYCRIMQENVSHLFKWYAEDVGLHLYARWMQPSAMYQAFCEEAARRGVVWQDGRHYDIQGDAAPVSAIFGLSYVDEEAWTIACQRMRLAWEAVSQQKNMLMDK